MENEKRLTEADKIAYHTIEKFIEENGYPPSVRDLCRIMGKASTATIQYRLKSLKQKGYITTTNRGKRTIRITKEIENAPTVDAVEVVHGRWELHGNDDDCGCSYFCSNCYESYDEDWFYVHGQYRHWNYCPNCGAKMDGDGNG